MAERFEDPAVRKSVEIDLAMIESLDMILRKLDLMLRDSQQAKYYVSKLERKYNKGKALGIFTHKLGRAVYSMLKNKEAFEMKQFFGN